MAKPLLTESPSVLLAAPPGNSAHTLSEESDGLRLLMVALAAAVLFHGGLMPFTHSKTYDAFIHMFFGDHYHRSWFDPWEPRWYTGFATTSYPPGTHMAMAALMYVMPLRAAFVVVQLAGLLLLTVGVYRYALLWVQARAAGYAAIGLVLASSISETIHLFGQLPTIFSLGVFLNGMPYVYRWIVFGRWPSFFAAVIFCAATTAAHHVTTLFGAVLFICPLAVQALRAVGELPQLKLHPYAARHARFTRYGWPFARGLLLAVFLVAAIALTVFPYWYWSITDPITQVSIPHGSRENYLVRPDLGFVFFVIPWGMSFLVLPYALYRSVTTRLWPLGASVFLCFVLGTGGTTPIPRMVLRGAFDILTLDRFTFWGSILILPFTGLMLDGLLHGRSGAQLRAAFGRGVHRLLVGGLFAGYAMMAVFPAILPTVQPTQPDLIDPTPITQFLASDQHDRWRYLTLGFGDQFAYVSALTTAQSVDGNYHSARRLPDMTRFSVERLENAKYLGVPGLGSLQQFLINAENYHLKYVFSNDAFYDPLLQFTGWNRLNRLQNGVVVWEKPDISPLPLLQPRRTIPHLHALLWGVTPPLALCLAALVFLTSALSGNFTGRLSEFRPLLDRRSDYVRPRLVRRVVLGLGVVLVVSLSGVSALAWRAATRVPTAAEVVAAYFTDLDFRRFPEAYARLDPQTRSDFDAMLFQWRWKGGLIASYGKLEEVSITPISGTGKLSDWRVGLDWLTSVAKRHEDLTVRTVLRDGHWYVVPNVLRATQTPVRIQREGAVVWNVAGRRQPRPDTDLHRDRLDRPRIVVDSARLVKQGGAYSIVGQVTNTDADPAAVRLIGELTSGQGQQLAVQAAGIVNGQRLLPAETTGFRVAFEGVLSLKDAAPEQFDPLLFVPPVLAEIPRSAQLDARALVNAEGLYRGIALNGVSLSETPAGLHIEGLAVNIGTETASVIRIIALLNDDAGLPVWAEAGFVDTNIYPGQSAPFSLDLPVRSTIEVIADLPATAVAINGTGDTNGRSPTASVAGTIPLHGLAGYGSLRLQVSSLTFDPLF